MIDVNVHHHTANLAVLAVPMVSLFLRADTWAIVSGMLAATYYAIIIGNEVAKWIRHWKKHRRD